MGTCHQWQGRRGVPSNQRTPPPRGRAQQASVSGRQLSRAKASRSHLRLNFLQTTQAHPPETALVSSLPLTSCPLRLSCLPASPLWLPGWPPPSLVWPLEQLQLPVPPFSALGPEWPFENTDLLSRLPVGHSSVTLGSLQECRASSWALQGLVVRLFTFSCLWGPRRGPRRGPCSPCEGCEHSSWSPDFPHHLAGPHSLPNDQLYEEGRL